MILPETDIDFEVKSNHELESAANPLTALTQAVDETLVVENENFLELASGQDKETKYILFDKKCEELNFPNIFFKGKLRYTFRREHYVTSTNYLNQHLLNCLRTFASNSDYIVFAQFVLQQNNLSDQINMAMKKVAG